MLGRKPRKGGKKQNEALASPFNENSSDALGPLDDEESAGSASVVSLEQYVKDHANEDVADRVPLTDEERRQRIRQSLGVKEEPEGNAEVAEVLKQAAVDIAGDIPFSGQPEDERPLVAVSMEVPGLAITVERNGHGDTVSIGDDSGENELAMSAEEWQSVVAMVQSASEMVGKWAETQRV